jgi:hypothetical protein
MLGRIAPTLQRKSQLCIPFPGIAMPQSNFHIHVSVSRGNSFSGNICFLFSVLVLCSVEINEDSTDI